MGRPEPRQAATDADDPKRAQEGNESRDGVGSRRATTEGGPKPQEKLYRCDASGCGRLFPSWSYYKYHQAAHKGQKLLECDFEGCCRRFSWPTHLKYHLLTHTGSRPHRCPVEGCGRRFFTQQRLQVHMRVHTGERPFVCSDEGCDKSFTTAGNLKNHMRVHTGERPFVCPVEGCSKKFAEHSSLKKHGIVHTGEKPFACDLCGKSFSQSGSRNAHRRRHHGGGKPDAKSRRRAGGGEERHDEDDVEERGVIVLHGSDEEELLKLQDFCQGSETLTLTSSFPADIVTVAPHRPRRPSSEEDAETTTREAVDVEEASEGDGDHRPAVPNSSANVVVLAQPDDVIGMGYHFTHTPIHEEVVYESILLHSDLDKPRYAAQVNGEETS